MAVNAARLPRWRGFNLMEKGARDRGGPYRERDFQWIAEWGFDFVRLPLDYRCWTDPGDVYRLKEGVLKEIDDAVELGRQYGVHVNINFHRAPGYCVNEECSNDREPLSLWKDEAARRACEFHWRHFARRYRGVPGERLSFDLLNEPPSLETEGFTRQAHEEVVRRLVAAIREEDPGRLVIVDGLEYGRIPLPELADLGVAQSTRAYEPMWLTHYLATWVSGTVDVPPPTWPSRREGFEGGELTLRRHYRPWKELFDSGVGVHCGEWGVFNTTPQDVVLAWMEDVLTIFAEMGWGWALWNLRGPFGIVNTGREGVPYDKLDGEYELDRRMLELLQRF